MPGLFSRIKNWNRGENFKAADLNPEINNIISHLEPQYFDDESATLAAMKAEVTPGAQGSESLATSLRGELQRLRYVIRRALGTTYWYDSAGTDLASLKTTLEAGLVFPGNRIESGRIDANSQPMFLVPQGTTGVRLKGATTPFRAYIKNTLVTVSSDLDLTGLSSPSAFTALVNDTTMAAQQASKTLGERETLIAIDTNTGSAPSTGTFQAFKCNGDYFLGRFDSSTQISRCFRGFFFDNADAIIPRHTLSNNDTITLCRAAYIFLTNVGGTPALAVTYNLPVVSGTQPTGASSGDWWLDLTTSVWKKYNGVSWADGDGVWIGIAIMDGATIAGCRSLDFGKGFASTNTCKIEKVDSGTLRTVFPGCTVSVYGTLIRFDRQILTWLMASDLDSGITEAASTQYYFYLSFDGKVKISDVAPYQRTGDLLGFYHPSKPWRCLGYCDNDASLNLLTPFDFDLLGIYESSIAANKIVAPAKGLSSSSGTFSTTSATFTDVTNLTYDLVCGGKRMIEMCLISEELGASASDEAYVGTSATDTPVAAAQFAFLMDGTVLSVQSIKSVAENGSATTDPQVQHPPSSFRYILTTPPTAGTHTFKFQARKNPSTGTNAQVNKCKFLVREIEVA